MNEYKRHGSHELIDLNVECNLSLFDPATNDRFRYAAARSNVSVKTDTGSLPQSPSFHPNCLPPRNLLRTLARYSSVSCLHPLAIRVQAERVAAAVGERSKLSSDRISVTVIPELENSVGVSAAESGCAGVVEALAGQSRGHEDRGEDGGDEVGELHDGGEGGLELS
jgi:hypothetical protein